VAIVWLGRRSLVYSAIPTIVYGIKKPEIMADQQFAARIMTVPCGTPDEACVVRLSAQPVYWVCPMVLVQKTIMPA
jgi:hypothetical protein